MFTQTLPAPPPTAAVADSEVLAAALAAGAAIFAATVVAGLVSVAAAAADVVAGTLTFAAGAADCANAAAQQNMLTAIERVRKDFILFPYKLAVSVKQTGQDTQPSLDGHHPPSIGDYCAADAFLATFFTVCFFIACFFTVFLAGVVTGAEASADADVAAGAAGAAANDRVEPKRPAAMQRAVMLVFIMGPVEGLVDVNDCSVGFDPTEGNCTDSNLGSS